MNVQSVLKELDTIGKLLKIIVSRKNLLGDEQWRPVDSIKHCEKGLRL